jgi:hypothetical protein
MNKKDEAIHKALKVLNCLNNDRVYETAWVKGAINACEEALEQPAQEPVAWLSTNSKANEVIKTHQSQGLTDDEIKEIWLKLPQFPNHFDISRAIEQALKEKNG